MGTAFQSHTATVPMGSRAFKKFPLLIPDHNEECRQLVCFLSFQAKTQWGFPGPVSLATIGLSMRFETESRSRSSSCAWMVLPIYSSDLFPDISYGCLVLLHWWGCRDVSHVAWRHADTIDPSSCFNAKNQTRKKGEKAKAKIPNLKLNFKSKLQFDVG